MDNLAFIFPGQGSQYVGMGKDLYNDFPSAKKRFDQANEILDFDLFKVTFEGPEDKLANTRFTQPAIFVHSYAVFEILEESGYSAGMTAGHSLGEYSALAAAGVFDFEQGIRLVQQRGKLMQNAGNQTKGTMAAIIGLDFQTIHNLCQQASRSALVDVANFNSPQQIVISGTLAGVEKVMESAKKAGARRIVPLNVSAAFHSPLMRSVVDEFARELNKIAFREANVPVFSNVSGQATTDPDEIKMFLEKQLLSPVLWTDTVKHMIQGGATVMFEVGPGKVLSGLVRKIDKQLKVMQLGTSQDLRTL